MLPPVEAAILQSNPKFAALHANLAANILNPNGSTKSHPAQKERDSVSDALKPVRLRAAKSHLLCSALSNLDLSSTPTPTNPKPKAPTTAALPAPLLEVILLLSSRLNTPSLSPSSIKLLESTPQWNSLPAHLPQISLLISNYLQNLALALAKILTPTTNPSYLHRQIPKLLPGITALQDEVAAAKRDLALRRAAVVAKATTVLALYHTATTLVIRHLEQTKHGSISRHLKAKSEFLALSAQQVMLESREKLGKGERMVYTDAVRGALEEYVRHLRDARERLKERKGDAERLLWGYGVGRTTEEDPKREKERVMKEIARVYGELIREVRDVGKDVDRLKGGARRR